MSYKCLEDIPNLQRWSRAGEYSASNTQGETPFSKVSS